MQKPNHTDKNMMQNNNQPQNTVIKYFLWTLVTITGQCGHSDQGERQQRQKMQQSSKN